MNVQRSGVAASMLLFGGMIVPGLLADAKPDIHPNGRGDVIHGHEKASVGGAVVQGNGISYHNGPVMHGTTNIYYIWYGDWSQDAGANAILTGFASNIGGSPYFNINTTYGDTTANVTNAVHYASSTTNSGTLGTSLNDNSIWSIVTGAISGGSLPLDSNGVYFVLTAPGVAETTGFLTQYCGWHTYGTYNGTNVKFSFVGDAKGPSLGSCAIQTASSPNGDPSADAMASVIAHELEESVTDPLLNAWYDSTGEENADKCAWTFGTEYTVNNSHANMLLGSMNFLIQQNWLNANGGGCGLSYVSQPDFSVSVSPSSQSVLQGGTTGNYTATATPIGGFTGSVTWTMSALPAGLTSSAISSSGTFSLTAAPTMAPGTYSVTVTGTSGSLVHSATASVVVTSNANFTLSTSTGSITVKRGSSGSFTVTLTPSGSFSSAVSVSVSGMKTGITVTASPSSIPGGSGTSTVTVTANASAKRGSRSLTVTASGGGITHSASVTVTVQ